MNKEEKETQDKLKRLTKSIGTLKQPTKQKHQSKPTKKESKPTFKTSEVIVLLLITTIVSLIMGATVMYKLNTKNTTTNDKNLQELIKNYNYITENYNGKIDKEKVVDSAIEAMLNNLDKNSTYLEEEESENLNIYLEGSYDGLGIQIYSNNEGEILIYSVFKNSPADKAGLKAGDKITKINGKSTSKMTTKQLTNKIKNKKNKTIKLTYSRNGKEKTKRIKLATVNIKSVASKTYTKNNKKIGYIATTIFASNTYKQFKEQLTDLEQENIDSLIIDLRSNSGGYLSSAEDMISLFLDSSHVIYQIQKDGVKSKAYSKGNKTKTYKIIILVDSSSASASEVMTSALKEQYGATIIGEKTYGKGTVQEMQTLGNGDKYKLTTKNWLTSKGTWVDGKGITPDITITLNDKYYEQPTEENDNQLQTALEQAVK